MADWKPCDKGLRWPRQYLLETPEEWAARLQEWTDRHIRMVHLASPTPKKNVILLDIKDIE
jgi:hypothetical protein